MLFLILTLVQLLLLSFSKPLIFLLVNIPKRLADFKISIELILCNLQANQVPEGDAKRSGPLKRKKMIKISKLKVSTTALISFEQFILGNYFKVLKKISLETFNQFSINLQFYETTNMLAKITFQGFIPFFSFLERDISVYFCIQ